MRVLHCCLANFYIDNYEYQENVLPRMHKMQGHEVMILASTETFVDNVHMGYIEPSEYINEDGIPVHRIPYVSWLPHRIAIKLRYYKGVYEELERFQPDFIFIHELQFMSIKEVAQYIKKHPAVKLNIDSHADSGNTARTIVSRYFLHGIFYKWCAKTIEPFVGHFYGTLPARVDYLIDLYNIPRDKVSVLVMGADDRFVKKAKDLNQREIIRKRFSIGEEDYLIVAGGKFDSLKRWILNVMDAVVEISKEKRVRLLVFGSVMKDNGFNEEFERRCDGITVQYAGWINGTESYNYFEASDLVVFAGLHSVLWEQAVGQGKPCIFKYIPGRTHIDLGGNCKFLYDCSTEEIRQRIEECYEDKDQMLSVAEEQGMAYCSYYKIAERALN